MTPRSSLHSDICVIATLATAALAQAPLVSPTDVLARAGSAVHDVERGRILMMRRDYWSAQHDLLVFDGERWQATAPRIQLAQLGQDDEYSLVHDAVHGRVLAMASQGVWTLQGNTVTVHSSLPNPSGNPFATMAGRRIAHDPTRDVLLLFGGTWHQPSTYPPLTFYTDVTHECVQGTWVQRQPAHAPSPRAGYSLEHDPVRQRTVLFGGSNDPLTFADTWEWDGVDWTQSSATGPAAGYSYSTWDPLQQRIALSDRAGVVWYYDGAAYTPAATNGLGGGPARLVHDGTQLLAVRDQTATEEPSTWRLANGVFTRIATACQPVGYGELAYDSQRGEAVYAADGATWTWDATWTRHAGAPPIGPMAFDAARGETVLYGGVTQMQTWTWDGVAWTQRNPATTPPSTGARLAYDPIRQVVVMHCGPTSGTWLWNGIDWSADPGPQPPSGFAAFLVFDPVRQAIVMSGGSFANSTWEWDGQWHRRSATSGTDGVAAFDPQIGRVRAFYAHYSAPHSVTLREWDGTSWSSQPWSVALRTEYGVRAVTDTMRNRVLLEGVIHTALGRGLYVLGPTPTAVQDLGGACATTTSLWCEGRPCIGGSCTLVGDTTPASWSLFGFSLQQMAIPFGGCTAMVDGSLGLYWRMATPGSRVDLPIVIPNSLGLRGVSFVAQTCSLANGFAVSRGLRLYVGD